MDAINPVSSINPVNAMNPVTSNNHVNTVTPVSSNTPVNTVSKVSKEKFDPDKYNLSNTLLFQGMSDIEIGNSLSFLGAVDRKYEKGELVLRAGSRTDRMGLVLEGSVTIESNDLWGNCTILNHIGAGQFFAETYALLKNEVMLVDVRANEDCHILLLNVSGILQSESEVHASEVTQNESINPTVGIPAAETQMIEVSNPELLMTETPGAATTGTQFSGTRVPGTPFPETQFSREKEKLTRNLLRISANKNLALTGRSFHTSPKSARGRILSYLNSVSLQQQSSTFDIPFNRQQLADYLNLERTNMSKELARMRSEGIIEFRKNHFSLIRPDLA